MIRRVGSGSSGWSASGAFALLIFCLALAAPCGAKAVLKDLPAEGPQPWVMGPDGRAVPLYANSHALLISASAYPGVHKRAWAPLPNTGREMDAVGAALRRHGFHVRRMSDPDSVELRTEIRRFIGQYGREPRNRIVVFFSGHGHTDRDTQRGYLAPRVRIVVASIEL